MDFPGRSPGRGLRAAVLVFLAAAAAVEGCLDAGAGWCVAVALGAAALLCLTRPRGGMRARKWLGSGGSRGKKKSI